MSDISRKEINELRDDVTTLKTDVNQLQDWRKQEVDPMIRKAQAFENQLRGAKKILALMAIGIWLLFGERVSERFHIKDVLEIFSSKVSTVDNTVSAASRKQIVKAPSMVAH